MEIVRIETTQNVRIDYALASVGDRMLAFFIDVVIQLTWLGLVSYIWGNVGMGLYNEDVYIIIMLVILLPIAFYHLICELFMDGQSVGKMVMKIKVVRLDGGTPTLGNYLMRWLMRIFEIYMVFGMALLVILISGTGQRVGDIFARTTVIRKKRKYTLEDTILATVREDYQPLYPQVKNLSNRDVEIIREGLQYATRYRNYDILTALNDKVESTLGIPKHDMTFKDFLQRIVDDYNYYQSQE